MIPLDLSRLNLNGVEVVVIQWMLVHYCRQNYREEKVLYKFNDIAGYFQYKKCIKMGRGSRGEFPLGLRPVLPGTTQIQYFFC